MMSNGKKFGRFQSKRSIIRAYRELEKEHSKKENDVLMLEQFRRLLPVASMYAIWISILCSGQIQWKN